MFSHVFKANPYHDKLGRFSDASRAGFVSLWGKPRGPLTKDSGSLTLHEVNNALGNLKRLPSLGAGEGHFNFAGKPEISLRSVGFKGPGSVYGLRLSDEKKFRKVEILLGDLHYAQHAVQRQAVADKLNDLKTRDLADNEDVPRVVRQNGRITVQTGNHRLAALLLAGRRKAVVELVDYDGRYSAPADALKPAKSNLRV